MYFTTFGNLWDLWDHHEVNLLVAKFTSRNRNLAHVILEISSSKALL